MRKSFYLILQKALYSYEYMDSWQRLNEMSLLGKKNFDLTMEDIMDADYKHAKRVWQELEIQNLGK